MYGDAFFVPNVCMSHGHAVARNAAWLMLAQTGQKLISFLTFTFVARLVGVTVTGDYFYAVSVTSVFVVLTDLGLTPVVIREMAADEASGRAALAQAIIAKIFLIPLAIAASLIYTYASGGSTETLLAVSIACFVMSADAVSLLWYGALRGKRDLRFESVGMFVGQLLTAIVAFTVATAYVDAPHTQVYGLIFALLVSSVWNVGWSIGWARGKGIAPSWETARLTWGMRRFLRAATPFALAGIFVKIYSYVDTLMLKQFHTSQEIGWYAVAYKVTYAFQFVPLAFVAALYPGMSAAFARKDKTQLQELLAGSLRLMTITGVPMAALISSMAPRVIPVVYGEAFSGSVVPLQWLAWVLVPIFWDFPIGSLLNATHRAELKTTAMGIAMVTNVLLNALLIPTLGPLGAAIAGLGSFWLLFFLGLGFIHRDLPGFDWAVSLFGRGIAAGAGIWLAVTYATPPMPLVAALVFSVTVALAALFVTRLLTVQDVKQVFRWLARRPAPVDPIDETLHSKKP